MCRRLIKILPDFHLVDRNRFGAFSSISFRKSFYFRDGPHPEKSKAPEGLASGGGVCYISGEKG
jgi:hypothetical protein